MHTGGRSFLSGMIRGGHVLLEMRSLLPKACTCSANATLRSP